MIASHRFDERPRPIELQGVREGNRPLFAALDAIEDPDARARRFDDWVSVKFQLHHWQEQATAQARRSLRNSYLRFLRGWGVDASSVEGAVLKGWVESRLGIPPTFHRAPLLAPTRRRGGGTSSTGPAGTPAPAPSTRSSTSSTRSRSTSWRGDALASPPHALARPERLESHEILERLGPRDGWCG